MTATSALPYDLAANPYTLGAEVLSQLGTTALIAPALTASALQPVGISATQNSPFGPYASAAVNGMSSYVFQNQSPGFMSAANAGDTAEAAFGNLFNSMGSAIASPVAAPGIPTWMVIGGLAILVFFLLKGKI